MWKWLMIEVNSSNLWTTKGIKELFLNMANNRYYWDRNYEFLA